MLLDEVALKHIKLLNIHLHVVTYTHLQSATHPQEKIDVHFVLTLKAQPNCFVCSLIALLFCSFLFDNQPCD